MDINLIAGCFICWLLILCPDTVNAQDPKLTPVIKEFWLHNDASRVMSSASATVHATPNISCSAWSTLGPLTITVLRERDGAVLKKEVQNSVQFNLDPLRCEDTGVYLCQAENFQAKSTQKMEISVRCPPQLNRQHLPVGIDSPFYNGSVGGNLTIQLDIMSSPRPDWISLTTLNTKDVLASRSGNLTNGSGDSTKGQEPYWFEYIPTAPPYGSVELSIRNLSAKDIGNLFTLVVGNGEGTNLSYAFMIKKALKRQPHEVVTEAGPASPSSSIDVLAVGLGTGGALVFLAVVAVLVWLACRWYSRKGGDALDTGPHMEFRKRQNKSLVNSEDSHVSCPPVSSSAAVFDFSARPRNLTFHVREIQHRQSNQQQQQQQLHRKKQIQQLQQSADEDEKFSKEYQPQDRLSRSYSRPSESVENPYYIPGVSNAIVETGEENEQDENVYSLAPRNLSVQIDSEEGRNQLRHLDSVAKDQDRGKERQIEQEYDNINQTKQYSDDKPGIPVSGGRTAAAAATAAHVSAGSDIYDYPRSPDDYMKEAEWKIMGGSSGNEYVIPGQRRKFSLPKDDQNVYEF